VVGLQLIQQLATNCEMIQMEYLSL
jgi:hypothetical protein